MNIKQIMILAIILGCVVFPIGLVILLLNAMFVDKVEDSIMMKLIKELEE